MRVAVYYSNKDIRLEEMPVPKIGKGELLVKVMASGICGSDVMEWYRKERAPLVLGHEMTGEVFKVGEGANFKIGDRVFVSHHVPCETCHYCMNGHHTVCETLRTTNIDPGGFAEYIRVPRINAENGVYLLPDDMSFEDGTFIEPLACVVRGQKMANIQPDNTVLVIGSGISGLLHIQLAKLKGTKVIAVDINEYRLKAAKKFGADDIIIARGDVISSLLDVNNKKLADYVIVCTSALPAIEMAIHCADRGGTIVFFAPTEPGIDVSLSFNELWKNCMTLTTTYAAAPSDIREAIDLIRSKKINVNKMITHRLGLEETGNGFKLVTEARESIKVVIKPNE